MRYENHQPVHILLIEDSPGDADLLRLVLAEATRYTFEIESVDCLREGLDRLQQQQIDIVLLDLYLPDSSGLDTFVAVYRHAPTVPIVVLTGHEDDTLALDAVRQGAQDYLVKGMVDGRELARVIRYAIERKRAEEALRESEERFRSAFDYTIIGMALIDPTGRWLKVNQSMCAIVGYTEAELCAMRVQDIAHPDDVEANLAAFAYLLAGEIHYYHLEQRYIHKHGYPVWVMVSVSLVRDAAHKPMYFVAQVQDITQRKHVEEELARRVAELARSNTELEQFAYVASHDLQEPLRMVASYTQLLERRYKDQLDADASEFIAYAVDGVVRMQQLINDLLTFARVDMRGKAFGPVACQEIVQQALDALQNALKESNATVTYDTLPTVVADASQLRQVFQNLLGNAVKFRSTHPLRIHISATRSEKEWIFAVRDNGIGIEPQYAERIFVIFQRLHSRDQYPGTGIGLALCRKIVERHGGRIWVESQAGQGATFYFTIPTMPGPKPRLNYPMQDHSPTGRAPP